MKKIVNFFRELAQYPSAVAGLIILMIMVGIAVYALIAIPYDEAVRLWRGGEDIWYKAPRLAQPAWTNAFRTEKLPDTIVINTRENPEIKRVIERESSKTINVTFEFNYDYGDYPQEIALYFSSTFAEKKPFVDMLWVTPEGTEIRLNSLGISQREVVRISQDQKLSRKLNNLPPQKALFMVDARAETPEILKGTYQLQLAITAFDLADDVDVELVMHGLVYGLAGTDHQRRDLMVALLWGTPVALAFGLLAALGTTFTTMFIAAFGTWFGGWVDELIQRITAINMVLPFLPILIMVATLYSRSIMTILGVTIILSIFTGAILQYRAIFLQVKESAYIEAARAYGSGNLRIVFRYLTPRIIPMLVPQLVVLIPGYVFLEASLAVLGLGDPVLPTWGKIINDAQSNGALFQGQYYWVLEPAVLLIITGLAFAFIGFALDRIFNPRLRGI